MQRRTSRSRRVLAASFVVTATLVSACGGSKTPPDGPTMNPPAPDDDGGATSVDTSMEAGTIAAPTSSSTAVATGKLPPGVTMRPDGTCWKHEDAQCPPAPATCNPPPPMKVDCPK